MTTPSINDFVRRTIEAQQADEYNLLHEKKGYDPRGTSPLFEAAGKAKRMITAADMTAMTRSITRQAAIVCGGDPDCYLDYVRRAIAEVQESRAHTKQGYTLIADLPAETRKSILMKARHLRSDLPAWLREIKRLTSEYRPIYEVIVSYKESFFSKDDHQHIDIKFTLFSDDKQHNLDILNRLTDTINALNNIWYVRWANVSPNTTEWASRGLPGDYHLWIWADPSCDIQAEVITALAALPAEAWR